MLDRRFHLNFSFLGTMLNLLSTISFSDSLDELDDEMDENEDEEATFSFFLALTLTSFVSLCCSVLLSPGLMKENLFFSSLTCVVYLTFFLRKSLGFLIPSLLAHHTSYLKLVQFFALPHHWS